MKRIFSISIIFAMVVMILSVAQVSALAVGEEDFVLTISVEETTLRQGENFIVDVELKNNSDENRVIVHSFLFWPHIANWHILEEWGGVAIDPPAPRTRIMEPNGVIKNVNLSGNEGGAWTFGHTLEPGTHELRFRATFGLNDFQIGNQIEIWSNPITLTVLPPCAPDCDCAECTGFGIVPNTGIPGITGYIIAFFAFLALSMASWGYILRLRLIKGKNG